MKRLDNMTEISYLILEVFLSAMPRILHSMPFQDFYGTFPTHSLLDHRFLVLRIVYEYILLMRGLQSDALTSLL